MFNKLFNNRLCRCSSSYWWLKFVGLLEFPVTGMLKDFHWSKKTQLLWKYIFPKTVAPNRYSTHTVPNFCLQSRTFNKKEWLRLMVLLKSFMTSIYSIISVETSLVTHFSGYEMITLHKKAMSYVSNHDFSLFHVLKCS